MKFSVKTLTLLFFLAIACQSLIAQHTEVIQKAEAIVQLSSASGDSFRNEPLHKKMQPFRIIGVDNPANGFKTGTDENLASGLCVDNLYTSGCGFGDQLTSWELVNINEPSIPCSGTPAWYLDYTHMVHELEAGETYQLIVTAGYDNTHFAVWIDFDGNLDLTPNELLLTGICTVANTPYIFNLSIPANVSEGSYFMRVRTNWNESANDPCANYNYGQAIDFKANFSEDNHWISPTYFSGSVEPGGFIPIPIIFDSYELLPGTYEGMLLFNSNDPNSPHFVLITLVVDMAYQCFTIDPPELEELHDNPPQVSTQSILISNNCTGIFVFDISVLTGDNSTNDGNNQWLSVDPVSGTILPGASLEIEVKFNSSGLVSPGEYNGELEIATNDPSNPVYLIPVTLELENCGLPPVENFTCAYTDSSTVLLTWDPPQPDQQVLRWDDGNNYTSIGMPEGGSFTAAARWDATMMEPYHNWLLTHIAFFPTSADATFVVKAWIGEDLITSQPVMSINANVWNEVELDMPVQIIGAQELLIGFEVTHPAGVSPAGCDAGPAVAGFGDLFNGGTLSGMGFDHNWNLAGYISPAASGKKAILHYQHDIKSELLAYNVYKNDVLIATLATDETTFVDFVFPGEPPTYIIGAVYEECESMTDPCTPLPIAWMECVPISFNIALVQNETLTEELLISNAGHQNSMLDYQIEIQYITPEEDWLSLTPASGQIPGVSMDTVAITITTTNLQIGEHKANLLIASNAHNQQLIEIPVVLDLITGISQTQQSAIHIYPNPSKGIFTINGSANFAKVSVFNASGLEVYREEQALPTQVDLIKQPGGVFLIRVEINETAFTKKVILK